MCCPKCKQESLHQFLRPHFMQYSVLRMLTELSMELCGAGDMESHRSAPWLQLLHAELLPLYAGMQAKHAFGIGDSARPVR